MLELLNYRTGNLNYKGTLLANNPVFIKNNVNY